MRKIARYLVVVSLLAFSVPSIAQTGLGALQGIVFDEQGAVIPNVAVTITSPAIMGERSVMTSSKGVYRFINLPPGVYTIHVEKENFHRFEQHGILIRAGKTSGLNITLQVGTFEETVVIEYTSPIIDLKNPERRINIDGAFLDRLPLSTTREWTSALSLIPAAVMDSEFTGAELGKSIGGLSIHGASNNENIFSMDGASIQTETLSDPVMFTSSVIKDVEVVTSGYNASVRSGLGAYVNVVTRSGGNDFSGTFQVVLQPEDWNWENVEDGNTPKSTLYLPEGSIGGPIFKDRMWFFSSALYDYRDRGIYRDESALYWLAANGYSSSDYDYSEVRRSGRFFGKVTTALTENDKLVATFNWDRTENKLGQRNYVKSGRSLRKTGGPTFILNYSKFFSEDLLVSLQGTYRKADRGLFPLSGDLADAEASIVRYGEYQVSGGYISGTSGTDTVEGYGSPFSAVEEHTEFKGDVNYFLDNLWGQHELGFGAYYQPERKSSVTYYSAQPYSTLNQIRNSSGDWATYLAVYNPNDLPPEEYSNSNVAGYFQDSWTLNDRLTLNFGVRAEKNYAEVDIFSPTAISPNIGVSYALTGDQKQALRFSYSRKQEVLGEGELVATYYRSRTGGAIYYYDDNLDGVWDRVRDYSGGSYHVNDPDNLISDMSGAPIMLDEDLGPGDADFFQIGYTTVLPGDLTLDAAFIYNIFSNSFAKYPFYNILWENNEPVGLRDPSFSEVEYWANNKWSSKHYRGLEFSLSRAFKDGWQMMASYSYQTSTEKGEWSPYEPERYYFPESWFEYSDVSNKPNHVFRLAASYVGPFDIMFNGSVVYRSSLPGYAYKYYEGEGIVAPYYLILDGQFLFHPFNSMDNWAQARSAERQGLIESATTVNLGVGKIIDLFGYHLETQLQIFNVFNMDKGINGWANYVDENLEYIWPFIYNIQAPRAAQLLVKFVF